LDASLYFTAPISGAALPGHPHRRKTDGGPSHFHLAGRLHKRCDRTGPYGFAVRGTLRWCADL